MPLVIQQDDLYPSSDEEEGNHCPPYSSILHRPLARNESYTPEFFFTSFVMWNHTVPMLTPHTPLFAPHFSDEEVTNWPLIRWERTGARTLHVQEQEYEEFLCSSGFRGKNYIQLRECAYVICCNFSRRVFADEGLSEPTVLEILRSLVREITGFQYNQVTTALIQERQQKHVDSSKSPSLTQVQCQNDPLIPTRVSLADIDHSSRSNYSK